MTYDSWKARDRSLEDMGPDPEDELRAQEAEDEAFWNALFELAELMDEELLP